MVLIVSQLDLQALSKFNYCHIYFDSPRYCIRSCKLNSYLSARLILYSCTFPFLDHPSLNRTKTCRTVPKKVHNPLKQTPSIIKSAIFLPDVPLLSPMTDRAQTVSMIHNDSHCNQHDFIYL